MEKSEMKELAKSGMVVSLGVLVWTALGKGRQNRALHTWAGVAAVGFSVWHYNLYQPHQNKRP
ncbi:MAG: hypothetical protein JRD04_01725 [Deltaproteobacteria bacterium]|nr:hypothetical protein [Deltaproteobacteria bacterium]